VAYFDQLSPDATSLSDDVAYEWKNCPVIDRASHIHTIDCLWIWHKCIQVLSERSEAPGEEFGWRPSGVGAHTLVQAFPLTITASVYWPACCGMHGFITNGVYQAV
jgi:hypothetical protein